jgi:MYXO-CTERM domain-containing protein
MKSFFLRLFVVSAMATVLLPGVAAAQGEDPKPRILIVFDTSGSMAYNFAGTNTQGDGSRDPWPGGRFCCPGTGTTANPSRMWVAKEAMKQMLYASGEIEFGLIKFAQMYVSNQADGFGAGTADATTTWYRWNQSASVQNDVLRYDGSNDFSVEARYLAVGFGAQSQVSPYPRDVNSENSRAEVLGWFDHHEYSATNLGQAANSPFPGPYGDFKEQELRADGATPLGDALIQARTYLQTVKAADTFGHCRKYTVLVLTDGAYNGTDPVPVVTDIKNDGIDTWTIGLAYNDATLNAMAAAGGNHFDPSNPGKAFTADSQEALVSALFYIVSDSLRFEVCNYQDDNCNGRVDEGVIGQYCDIHDYLETSSYNPNWEPDRLVCEDPGETRCDGLDDNCNGSIDELPLSGTWSTYYPQIGQPCAPGLSDPDNVLLPCRAGTWQCVPGTGVECVNFVGPNPEVCDGIDNDCDGYIDEADGSTSDYSLLGEPCGLPDYVNIPPICNEGVQRCVAAFTWECEGGSFGGPEECNGLDDNCDGNIDESFPEAGKACYTGTSGCNADGSNCVGLCRAGVWTCEGGALVCSGEQLPAANDSICDGLDEDCDGLIDEDVVGIGTACPSDVVAAATTCAANPTTCPCRAGTLQCQGAAGMQCVGEVVRPGPEVCDGIDNNCDGTRDEGLFGSCGGCLSANYPMFDCIDGDPGAGECRVGIGGCNSAASTPGNPVFDVGCTDQGPVQEICDGKDNDCDGLVDNADPSMTPVTGACYPAGLPGCTDNGDGTYDCEGECRAGSLSCVNGRITCTGHTGPVSEGSVCDNLDNNCNGLIDEGIVQECDPEIDPVEYPDALPGVGACRRGIQQCENGSFGACEGAGQPGPELCNGIDDDCDGHYEDNEAADLLGNPDSFVGLDCGACPDMKFACIVDETVVDPLVDIPLTADVPGAYRLECEGTAAQPEECNGNDDNCNGVPDDGIPPVVCGGCSGPECAAPDAGECETGLSYCLSAAWSPCYGSIGPVVEVCDGLDNDCNGTVDDGLSMVGQICQTATGSCSAGVWECWTDLGTFETAMHCCDAQILADEDECVPPTVASMEVCDGIDNNCNGEIDENIPGVGLPCGIAIGECAPGITQCVQDGEGNWGVECIGATAPTEEICDGLDNNCDGAIDNEIPPRGECCNAPGWMTDVALQAEYPNCIGVCNMGQEICVNGVWQCNAIVPAPEICDGLDNDCDGLVDENLDVECPIEGSVCIEGQCAEPCSVGEYSCPGGKDCVQVPQEDNQWLCLSNLCDPSSADALPCVFNDYYCSDGFSPPCRCDILSKSCVDRCYGRQCAEGSMCVVKDLGRCHPTSKGCTVTGCGAEQVCVDMGASCTEEPCQECVADPCAGKTCDDGQYCNASGDCVGTCVDVKCPGGSGCREGKCVSDPCAGVVCEVGVLCNPANGRCDGSLPNPCRGMSCDFFEVCKDGACVFSECWNIQCPPGSECREGSCYLPRNAITDDTDSSEDTDSVEDTSDDTGDVVDTDNTGGDTAVSDYKGLTDVLVTGAGGCLCSGAPGSPVTSGHGWVAMLGLLSLFLLRRRIALPLLIGGAAFLALGCQVEPYRFNDGTDDPSTSGIDTSSAGSDSGGGDTETGGGTDEDTETDTVTPLCTFGAAGPCAGGQRCCLTSNEVAICVDVTKSPGHCGACNNACSFPNAAATCSESQCRIAGCESFYQDLDSDDDNGCEYFCQPTVSPDAGADHCDGKDNDCDGEIDEDVDFDNDPLNCAECGNICRFNHAQALCAEGSCVMGDCDPDWHDINNDPSDGCEYFCVGDPDAEETCNFKDDNCDGLVDNELSGIALPGTGEPCYPSGTLGCELVGDAYVCQGICRAGTTVCSPTSGTIVCSGFVIAQKEVCDADGNACCDGLDNNCNGIVDEGGSMPCGGNPDGDPDEGECRPGLAMCKSDAAAPGAPVYDTDNCVGDVKPAAEICDGKDNDCDGAIDEVTDTDGNNLTAMDVRIGMACGVGECAANVQYCDAGTVKCTAVYTSRSEIPCNGKDDNCNGIVDEITTYSCGGSNGVVCNDTVNGCHSFSEGMCQAGVFSCSGTEQICAGDVKPACADDEHCDLCDGIDNDCDGLVDEDAFYGISDRSCGEPCLDGELVCENGVMRCDGATEATADLCDGIDNDCNPLTPDGSGEALYLQPCDGSDADSCAEGVFVCAETTPGNYGMVCNETGPGRVEVCDGVDNDCDGIIDNNLTPPTPSSLGCSACPGGVQVVCEGASGWRCRYNAAEVECVDEAVEGWCTTHRTLETQCNGKDGDCDGVVDDDFQFNTNVLRCGGCGVNCNTVAAGWLNVSDVYCLNGTCQIKTCDDTFINADRDNSTGCECQINPACLTDPNCDTCEGARRGVDDDCDGLIDEDKGVEVCNGIDDDCDGDVDEGLSNPGFCQPLCSASFVSTAACVGGAWTCDYQCGAGALECQADPQHPATGAPRPTVPEARCDGVDGNCDGVVDEPWRTGATGIGTACTNASTGAVGGCLRNGVYKCSAAGTGTVCCDSTLQPTGDICLAGNDIDITSATQFQQPEGTIPNGIDDDCDGVADDGIDSCVQAISTVSYTASSVDYDFDIFAFEASRYDATNADSGSLSTVPCSRNLVIPWTSITQEEAEMACWNLNPGGDSLGGWQLCSAQQWQMACEMGGGVETLYPYGDIYGDDTCNGTDYGDSLLSTGYLMGCVSEWGAVDVFDMSGNAEEWTSSETGAGSGLYQIRGGSYNDQAGGLTCGFDFWAAAPTNFRMPNLGFRCCNGDDPADLCEAITCNTPPDDVCMGDVLRKYTGAGQCVLGDCPDSGYAYIDIACPQGDGCISQPGDDICDYDKEDWLMYLAVDDQFDLYFGSPTQTEGARVLRGTQWNRVYTCADAPAGACNGHKHSDYLYIATASNWSGAQGFLGYFRNTTLDERTTTGDDVWEVFPAGAYCETNPLWTCGQPKPAHWTTNPGDLPTQAQVDAAIAFAGENDLWVTPFKHIPTNPQPYCWINEDFADTGCSAYWGYNPWSVPAPYPGIPGHPDMDPGGPDYDQLAPTMAHWIWHDSERNPTTNAPGAFRGFDHDEFLIFRVAGAITQAPE